MVKAKQLPKEQCCRNCFWYHPERNITTGRALTSRAARCLWRIPGWPKQWPQSMLMPNGQGPLHPAGHAIWANDGHNCAVYQGKGVSSAAG